jgi:hypothetical protein
VRAREAVERDEPPAVSVRRLRDTGRVSVLDASAALEFLLGTAAGAAVAHRVVEERGFAAPELLRFEVLAVLRRSIRRSSRRSRPSSGSSTRRRPCPPGRPPSCRTRRA